MRISFAAMMMALMPVIANANPLGEDADVNKISSAIKAGNASALAVHFDNTVEVTILNKEGAYSKSQAELVVKDFFGKNAPTDFKIMHEGSSGGNSKYAIGTLSTANGEFRTYMFLKQTGDTFVIQELKFESK